MKKNYEFTGVMTYAKVFCISIDAESEEQARQELEGRLDDEIYEGFPEFDGYDIDETVTVTPLSKSSNL